MARYTFTQSFSDGERSYGSSVVIDDEGAIQVGGVPEFVIAADAEDLEVACPFVIADTSAIYIRFSQEMTIKTNSDSAPDDSFTLPANHPLVWDDTMVYDNPFTANVTKFFITNESGTQATGLIRIAQDVTPGGSG